MITSSLNIGEIWCSLYRRNYFANDHRRDLGFFFLYADRITSPMVIAKICGSSLYRRNYFSDEHRRDPWFLYTDRITSPLNIGEIWCSSTSLYRRNYFVDDHRRDLVFLYTGGINSPSANFGEICGSYIQTGLLCR